MRNINNLRDADDTTLMVESEKELRRLLMKVKKEREKAGLKLNSQSKRENEITQRIIQYFEDPKDSSALAQVKKISQKAKNQK